MAANSTINGDESTNYYGSSGVMSEAIGAMNGITVKGRTKTYGTYLEMLQDRQPGKFAYVLDASADSTVGSGFAYYVYEEGVWKKLFEQEAMDIEHSGHNHTNMEVLNLFSIVARRPVFDGRALAYKTELDREIARIESKSSKPSQFRYEFIDDEELAERFPMEEKTYIIRNSKFVGTLPSGVLSWEEVCFRIVVDEASAAKGGFIAPYTGDSINGEEIFRLDQTMDIRIIYDRKNKDWVVIGTLN